MKKSKNGRRGLVPLSLFFAVMLCWCCAGRADFELPESLSEIGDEAFAGCSALNVVSVPENVSVIGENAFSGCGEALLIVTGAGCEAVVNYARANMVDYRAGTQYRALLIGQMYTDSTVESLNGPVNDVQAMQTRLSQIGWEVTAKSDLTAEGIRTWIGSAFGGSTENDVSLFYYSGHGEMDGSLVGADGKELAPESLREAMDSIPGRKVIIVDACYSGKLIEEEGGQKKGVQLRGTGAKTDPADENEAAEAFVNSFQAAFKPRLRGALNANNYFVITAARANEASEEQYISSGGRTRVMGVFTYYLCKGIGYDGISDRQTALKADTNGDGAVSIQEAYEYAAANALAQTANQHAAVWPGGCKWFAPFRE